MGADTDALCRVMRAAAGLGALEMREEGDRRVFSLTPLGEVLRASHPASIRDGVLWETSPAFQDVWAKGIVDYCKTGEIQMAKGFPNDTNLFEAVERTCDVDTARAFKVREGVGAAGHAWCRAGFASDGMCCLSLSPSLCYPLTSLTSLRYTPHKPLNTHTPSAQSMGYLSAPPIASCAPFLASLKGRHTIIDVGCGGGVILEALLRSLPGDVKGVQVRRDMHK